MGKSILTSKQLDFLELAQAQTAITKNFYLTGGTALAEFYFDQPVREKQGIRETNFLWGREISTVTFLS